MMKKWWLGFVLFLALACPTQVWAAESAAVTLPDFAVTLNGVAIDNIHRQYPLLVYKGMTYFPLTYDDSRFLGLETGWTEVTGLTVERTNVSAVYKEALTGSNSRSLKARTVDFPVTVNGEKAQADGTYPFLSFRGVTYIPLTWHYCTELFGWEQHFEAKAGLVITASNPQINGIRQKHAIWQRYSSWKQPILLAAGQLWVQDGLEIVTMPLTEPEKRTVVATSSQAEEMGRFEQVGEASYFTESGLNGQRYLLLPDGKWEKIAQDVYKMGNWEITLVTIDWNITGNLTIRSLQSGHTVAADTRYHYHTNVSEQGNQQLIQSGDRLYLIAEYPQAPKGTMICQVELATGETTVIGYGGELVLDGGWLYYVGYDDARGRDAYYLYSLASGLTEQVPVDHQMYDMALANVYTVLQGQLYYKDFTQFFLEPPTGLTEQEQEQYDLKRRQANHSGDGDLYRQGETTSLNPGGHVVELAQAGDYVYAIFTPREELAAAPYRLMIFDRQGKTVFKTTDDVSCVSISGHQAAYTVENMPWVFWVTLE